MTTMYKHVGKIINTDARCVVVFMQIPGCEDHALVVNMDTLPPHFERPIRQILESAEGQRENNFYEIISRRLMPDNGVKILDALFSARLLQKVHIDQVVMMPRPSMAFPLRQVIKAMAGEAAKALPPQTDFAAEKFNPHIHNQQVRTTEERVNIARGLLAEAHDLRQIAEGKVTKAYQMAPELAPRVSAPVVAPVWEPPPRLPVIDAIDANTEVASEPVFFDDVLPAPVPVVIDSAERTAAAERYAMMMMGELSPEPVTALHQKVQETVKKTVKPRTKAPAKAKTAAKKTAVKKTA